MPIDERWEQEVDMVVTDPLKGVLLVVEVKRTSVLGPVEKDAAWHRLLDFQKQYGAAYALLFTPERSFLYMPDGGVQEFDSRKILANYGISEIPSLNGGYLTELALHTWLVDLTIGYAVPQPPVGFPDVRDDRVLWAA